MRIKHFVVFLALLLLLPVSGLSEDVIRLMASDYPVEKNGWYSVMEIQSQLSHAAMDLVDGGPWIALGKR